MYHRYHYGSNFLSQALLPYNFGQSTIRDPTMSGLDLARPLPCDTEYIYCIRLPFSCISKAPVGKYVRVDHSRFIPRHHPYSRQIAHFSRGRQQQQTISYHISGMPSTPTVNLQPSTPQVVVKVGKTDNPARRFHEIFGAFQNLRVTESDPLLQVIRGTDDPKVVLESVKVHKISSVVFLMEVQAQDIETAEKNIRGTLGVPLGQDFKESFLQSLADEEQKKRFDSNAGMSEWILMDSALATNLQYKFHNNMLYWKSERQQNLFEIFSGVLQTPSGSDLHQHVFSHCLEYTFQKRNSSRPSEVTISLPDQLPIFSYTFKTQ